MLPMSVDFTHCEEMKYRDIITLFVSILFILSLAYSIGVDNSVWFLPVLLFVTLVIVIYELWL